MQIPKSDWEEYVRKLKEIDEKTAQLIQGWLDVYGYDDLDALIVYAQNVSEKYGDAAAALACEMYEAIAEAQGIIVSAVPAAAQTMQYFETGIDAIFDIAPGTIADFVGRTVKQRSADTMLQNAARDGAEFAWIPHGDTCPFCIMLASNGWQRMSKKAIKNGHAEHIHTHCDCTYAVRFDGVSGIEGYDRSVYLSTYENAKGKNWEEKVNSMRKERYEEDREKIRKQQNAAYAARKEREKEKEQTK